MANTVMAELELKFRGPDGALASLHDALRAHGATSQRLQARYFDTADGQLARQRVALRLRKEGRLWLQAVKAAGDGAVHRLEHEVRVPTRAGRMPAIDPHRHDGSDAGRALDAALHATPGAALIERHATDVVRLRCMVHDAVGSEVEVALDTGHVSASGRSLPLLELELEHKAGPVQGLFDLAAAWVEHGGLWLCTISKAERGERLLRAPAVPAATRAKPPQLAGEVDGPSLMRASLQSVLEQVLANVSDIAEGVTAAETIHQARVGLRRLRTVLRELAALSPSIPAQWDGVLSAAFGRLGERRDEDAVAAAVRPLLQAAAAPRLVWTRRTLADPVQVVRDPGFQRTLIELLALAHAGDERFAPLSASGARNWVVSRLDDLHTRVFRDGRRFEKLELARQHRLRKRLKRLRYLAELVAEQWPREAVRSFLKELGAAQDALGHHNDVAVAADLFRGDAAAEPASWFAAGYLQAHLAVTARDAHKALAAASQAQAFWK
ncbi:MAG TPA: CHAD domain-containing protein [Burkholderiaceae bacterium]